MLGIAAFIGIFIATYYAYKTAKDYDRNPIMWAAIVFGIGFGIQVIVPIVLVLIIGVYFVSTGTPPELLESELQFSATVISIVCVILSVVGMVLVLRRLGTVPDDAPISNEAPPPPPEFSGN